MNDVDLSYAELHYQGNNDWDFHTALHFRRHFCMINFTDSPIHLFITCLLITYYVPGIELGTGDAEHRPYSEGASLGKKLDCQSK